MFFKNAWNADGGQMLRISFNGSDQRLIAALRSKPQAIFRVLTTKLSALMFQLQVKIVTEKLSGQTLKRQTGKLAGSIRALPTVTEGSKILGGVEGAGGPAFYGAVHEYGGTAAYQIVAVRARALRFVMDGKVVFARSVIHPPAKVRAFMGPSLDESADTIRTE